MANHLVDSFEIVVDHFVVLRKALFDCLLRFFSDGLGLFDQRSNLKRFFRLLHLLLDLGESRFVVV